MHYVVGSKTVTLVNSQDEVLGEMDIFKAHEKPFYLHRASSVWLYRKKGQITEVLLQQRSKFKPIGANWWGNGVCANVRPDESYEDCAYRRLTGELAIKNPKSKIDLRKAYKFEYKAYGNEKFSEHEMDQVFVAKFDELVNPNPDEVAQIIWINWQELQTKVGNQKNKILSAQESLTYTHEQLRKLAPPIEIKVASSKLSIAPWTAMMIMDERLQQNLA